MSEVHERSSVGPALRRYSLSFSIVSQKETFEKIYVRAHETSRKAGTRCVTKGVSSLAFKSEVTALDPLLGGNPAGHLCSDLLRKDREEFPKGTERKEFPNTLCGSGKYAQA